ncbi:hypothetical protein C8J57DRAFT_1259125 [Mycena rebaudengoi]|nr:hypothetical protein C8J57DRAFT_1259125 [Mycena rebaudengoi]
MCDRPWALTVQNRLSCKDPGIAPEREKKRRFGPNTLDHRDPTPGISVKLGEEGARHRRSIEASSQSRSRSSKGRNNKYGAQTTEGAQEPRRQLSGMILGIQGGSSVRHPNECSEKRSPKIRQAIPWPKKKRRGRSVSKPGDTSETIQSCGWWSGTMRRRARIVTHVCCVSVAPSRVLGLILGRRGDETIEGECGNGPDVEFTEGGKDLVWSRTRYRKKGVVSKFRRRVYQIRLILCYSSPPFASRAYDSGRQKEDRAGGGADLRSRRDGCWRWENRGGAPGACREHGGSGVSAWTERAGDGEKSCVQDGLERKEGTGGWSGTGGRISLCESGSAVAGTGRWAGRVAGGVAGGAPLGERVGANGRRMPRRGGARAGKVERGREKGAGARPFPGAVSSGGGGNCCGMVGGTQLRKWDAWWAEGAGDDVSAGGKRC